MPNRTRTIVIGFCLCVVSLIALGCGNPVEKKTEGPPKFKGVTVKVSLQKGSPLLAGVKTAISEWEFATEGKAELVEAATPDVQADVCIADGRFVGSVQNPIPIPDSILTDRKVDVAEISPGFRQHYCTRGGKVVAIPVGVEMMLLWYRDDLFTDKTAMEEFQKQFKEKLVPPSTWDEYLRIAKFFHKSRWVKNGCVAATDATRELIAIFESMCASYAKGINWYSFEIDTESGQSRLSQGAFVKGLTNFLEALKYSPSADGKTIDALSARKLFRSGDAAMLLSPVPPTIDGDSTEPGKLDEKFGVADLPGSFELFDAHKNEMTTLKKANVPSYVGTGGWCVMLGQGSNREAAAHVVQWVGGKEQAVFLIQGVRKGYIPIRPSVLLQYERFTSYGLKSATTTRMLGYVTVGLQKENWANCLRVSEAPELDQKLVAAIRSASEGKATPKDALAECEKQWKAILDPKKDAFVNRYRDSIGLLAK